MIVSSESITFSDKSVLIGYLEVDHTFGDFLMANNVT